MLQLAVLAAVRSTDPKYAKNFTFYHVNPGNYSGLINMDAADVGGDAFFAMRSYYVPMECNHTSSHPSLDCVNPEVTSDNLTVTEVLVEVDTRWGPYGKCNVCIGGHVPFGEVDCTDGDYVRMFHRIYYIRGAHSPVAPAAAHRRACAPGPKLLLQLSRLLVLEDSVLERTVPLVAVLSPL